MSWRLVEETPDEPHPRPAGFPDEVVEHEGRSDTAHKDALRLSAGSAQREIDSRRRSPPLETEQRRDVHPVPNPLKGFGRFSLDEEDIIAATVRTVISRDFHQAERRILVPVAGLYEKDVLLGHDEPSRPATLFYGKAPVPDVSAVAISAIPASRPQRSDDALLDGGEALVVVKLLLHDRQEPCGQLPAPAC